MTAPTATTEDQPAQKKQMSLPELRKFDGQLFVQNNTPQFITFHESMGDKRVDFDLEPMGEPDSITFLPKLALDMRGLQKLWMKGAISISDDPEMEDQIMLMNAQSVGASEARMREIMGKTEESNVNSQMEEKLCLSCGQRNTEGVIVRGRVIQSRRQVKDGEPPLCIEHVGEASQWIPRLVSEKGEDHWEFSKLSMGKTLH